MIGWVRGRSCEGEAQEAMEGTLLSLGLRGHLGGMKVREGGRKQHGSPKGVSGGVGDDLGHESQVGVWLTPG